MCVQEEERLVMEMDKDIIMTNMGKSMIVKGKLISFVCYESNMVDNIYNTWWIDFGFTIHVLNTLQGIINLRKPLPSEQNIY
jgi:hypothetical protein